MRARYEMLCYLTLQIVNDDGEKSLITFTAVRVHGDDERRPQGRHRRLEADQEGENEDEELGGIGQSRRNRIGDENGGRFCRRTQIINFEKSLKFKKSFRSFFF